MGDGMAGYETASDKSWGISAGVRYNQCGKWTYERLHAVLVDSGLPRGFGCDACVWKSIRPLDTAKPTWERIVPSSNSKQKTLFLRFRRTVVVSSNQLLSNRPFLLLDLKN